MKLKWDHYSDQPAIIKDKKLKRQIYLRSLPDFLKTILSNLFLYPLCLIIYLLKIRRKTVANTTALFGLGINPDKGAKETYRLINDLGVKNLLIRVPLADIENLSIYLDFATQYSDKKLLINILQDRRHIEDHQLLKKSLDQIFQKFSPIADSFQLGNAINRKNGLFFQWMSF